MEPRSLLKSTFKDGKTKLIKYLKEINQVKIQYDLWSF